MRLSPLPVRTPRASRSCFLRCSKHGTSYFQLQPNECVTALHEHQRDAARDVNPSPLRFISVSLSSGAGRAALFCRAAAQSAQGRGGERPLSLPGYSTRSLSERAGNPGQRHPTGSPALPDHGHKVFLLLGADYFLR